MRVFAFNIFTSAGVTAKMIIEVMKAFGVKIPEAALQFIP